MSLLAPASPTRLRSHRIPDHRPPARTWAQTCEPMASMPTLPLFGASAELLADDHRIPAPLRQEASRLSVAIVDTVSGRRPCAQLVRWVTDEVLAELMVRVRQQQRLRQLLSVRTIHLQRVSERLEVSVRLGAGDRSIALALCLEPHRTVRDERFTAEERRAASRLVCTAIDFGPPIAMQHSPQRDTPRRASPRRDSPARAARVLLS